MSTRPPAVAGTFYPGTADALATSIADAFRDAASPPIDAETPKALVVPHAGYPYSGPVAASAYRLLLPRRASISRVLLVGPSHRVPFRGIAISGADRWETPLGTVPIDVEARAHAAAVPGVFVDDRPHAPEHSLEVQVPFLQTVLDEFALVPAVVGTADTETVAELLRASWGGPETLVVVSTDLSHYEPYRSARDHDARTVAAILQREASRLEPLDACGVRGLSGLLQVAAEDGLAVQALDVRNSGDTAGDRSRVVGYGAFALH